MVGFLYRAKLGGKKKGLQQTERFLTDYNITEGERGTDVLFCFVLRENKPPKNRRFVRAFVGMQCTVSMHYTTTAPRFCFVLVV